MATCKELTDEKSTNYKENVTRPVPAPRRSISFISKEAPVPRRRRRSRKDTESVKAALDNSNEKEGDYDVCENVDCIYVKNESGECSNEENKFHATSENNYEYLSEGLDDDDDAYENILSGDIEQNELRLVMVGKTGAGKSATANLIIPGNNFRAMASGQSVTRRCQSGFVKRDGYRISIIDTPGLMDTDLSVHEIRKNIIDCIQMTVPGPHVFLIIIQIGRFTNEEIEALDNLFQIFGNSMESHAMLVFTRNDDLQRDGITLETYLQNGGDRLQSYVTKCKNRYVAVNNFANGEERNVIVKEFIDNVVKIAEDNDFIPYTHEMIDEAKKNVQPLLERAKRENDTATQKEVEEIESLYERMKLDLNKERDAISDKIRKCTEDRDKLLEKRRMRILENDNAEPLSNKFEQLKLNNIEEELSLTYTELKQHTEKQKEIENKYVSIRRRKKKQISSVRKDQHEKTMSELLRIKDEHFKQMEILIKNISIIDQQLDGVDRELKTVTRKADKKRLTARRSELLKERERAGGENKRYVGDMMEKSSNLHKQLARKGQMCKIM